MPDNESYRLLDTDLLIEQVASLRVRIDERFPTRRLACLCAELELMARETRRRVLTIRQPMLGLRVTVGLAMILLVVAGWATVRSLGIQADHQLTAAALVGIVDGLTSELLLAGAAMVFLVRTERRVKQKRMLAALHELRSLAHVIDTHQLDKDPDRIFGASRPTEHSPKPDLTAAETVRYLNYCSMMLSLIGHLAAVYVQSFNDDVTAVAVNEVENLCQGLSRKVWQKIMIIHQDPRYRASLPSLA